MNQAWLLSNRLNTKLYFYVIMILQDVLKHFFSHEKMNFTIIYILYVYLFWLKVEKNVQNSAELHISHEIEADKPEE